MPNGDYGTRALGGEVLGSDRTALSCNPCSRFRGIGARGACFPFLIFLPWTWSNRKLGVRCNRSRVSIILNTRKCEGQSHWEIALSRVHSPAVQFNPRLAHGGESMARPIASYAGCNQQVGYLVAGSGGAVFTK